MALVRQRSAVAFLIAILQVADATGSCLDAGEDCSLRDAAAEAGMRVGAAMEPSHFSDPDYGPVLALEFDSLTLENSMKWQATEPVQDNFSFAHADAAVAFADANSMTVRGHNLVWAQARVDSTPDWVEAITDPDELRAVLATHVQTVVGRYAGKVDAWDVVNEPLETAGTALFENHFFQVLGPGYIAEAFALAHAADPSATLFLNEVLISNGGPKFDAFLALVTDLLQQGVPIHGVGFQGHYFGPPDPVQLEANLRTFADLGLIVEITELDSLLRPGPDLASRLAVQGDEYFAVARACARVPACARITTWGFTDRYTWIDSFLGPGFAPLPLDVDYNRKPAHTGLRNGMLERIAPTAVPVWSPGWSIVAWLGFSALGTFRLREPGRRDAN